MAAKKKPTIRSVFLDFGARGRLEHFSFIVDFIGFFIFCSEIYSQTYSLLLSQVMAGNTPLRGNFS